MSDKEIRGSIRVALSGGPLDGAMYGDLPDPGKPMSSARLSIPLTEPAETAVRAVYICHQPGSRRDVWQFTFYKIRFPKFPNGTQVHFS